MSQPKLTVVVTKEDKHIQKTSESCISNRYGLLVSSSNQVKVNDIIIDEQNKLTLDSILTTTDIWCFCKSGTVLKPNLNAMVGKLMFNNILNAGIVLCDYLSVNLLNKSCNIHRYNTTPSYDFMQYGANPVNLPIVFFSRDVVQNNVLSLPTINNMVLQHFAQNFPVVRISESLGTVIAI